MYADGAGAGEVYDVKEGVPFLVSFFVLPLATSGALASGLIPPLLYHARQEERTTNELIERLHGIC